MKYWAIVLNLSGHPDSEFPMLGPYDSVRAAEQGIRADVTKDICDSGGNCSDNLEDFASPYMIVSVVKAVRPVARASISVVLNKFVVEPSPDERQ